MKKIIFLITLCLLLTGCTANYNLEITNNEFKESITGNVLNTEIEEDKNATDINMHNYLLRSEQNVFYNNDNILYNKKHNDTENGIDFEYTYTFNENNFINSRILNECFDNYTFENKNNEYYISLSGNFYCNYADTTNINLTTDYKVTAHNAESKKQNTYTWKIDKDNTEDLSLFITIDKSKKASNNIGNWNTLKTIGLVLLVALSGIAIFIAKKKLDN